MQQEKMQAENMKDNKGPQENDNSIKERMIGPLTIR